MPGSVKLLAFFDFSRGGRIWANRRAALVGFVWPKSSSGIRWVRSAKIVGWYFGFVWSK
jgi:hypothetical protein